MTLESRPASPAGSARRRLALPCAALMSLVLLASGSRSAPGVEAVAAQSRQVGTLTIVLSGRTLYNKAVQEGIVMAVPWNDLVGQFFSRQNVPVTLEFWRSGPGDRVVLVDDARKRSFEPERAKALLARYFGYSQGGLKVFCEPDLCHVAHWLRPFLDRAGLAPSEPIAGAPNLESESMVFWIRAS